MNNYNRYKVHEEMGEESDYFFPIRTKQREEINLLMKRYKKKIKKVTPGTSGLPLSPDKFWGWTGGKGHGTWS
jgi:hypothetical protein